MREKNSNISEVIAAFIAIAALVVGVLWIGFSVTDKATKPDYVSAEEDFEKQLQKMLSKLQMDTAEPIKGKVDLLDEGTAEELDDISIYPIVVKGNGQVDIEIASSTEKSGEGMDGWLVDVANNFNQERLKIGDKTASVSIRYMASGTAVEYIAAGKYLPQGYTPSNELWGEMLKAKGIPISLVDKRLVGNPAGIVMQKKKYDEFLSQYGSVSIKDISEATIANELAMGYTNPLASSAGLNFLVTPLGEFDLANPLSEGATKQFQNFQENVPFVAYSTIQMREATQKGRLDAMILEYQTYRKTKGLEDFVFTPYGMRHDNPMYAVGNLSIEEMEVLKAFTEYALNESSQRLAGEYGFNALDNYVSEVKGYSGEMLWQAQKLWKEEKNSGKPIMAVFVSDTSGSMAGGKLESLKKSLLTGSKYINSENMIGLISYNSKVSIDLPIAPFDLNQAAYFNGAVEGFTEGGNTATYDAVVVALNMLNEGKKQYPDAKCIMFLLSDGMPQGGKYNLKDVQNLVTESGVMIHTIGYGEDANAEMLSTLSSINEGANESANPENVTSIIKNFFNAEM